MDTTTAEQSRALRLLADGYTIAGSGFTGVDRCYRREEGREYPRTARKPRITTMRALEREGLVEYKWPAQHRDEGIHEPQWVLTAAGREVARG